MNRFGGSVGDIKVVHDKLRFVCSDEGLIYRDFEKGRALCCVFWCYFAQFSRKKLGGYSRAIPEAVPESTHTYIMEDISRIFSRRSSLPSFIQRYPNTPFESDVVLQDMCVPHS